MFGLFDLDSSHVKTAVATLVASLRPPGSLGIVRYERDDYNNRRPGSLGNPWFVTTLWLAQYYLETNQLPLAQAILDWVHEHMLDSGALAEQLDPTTNEFISVAPLAWSQAEFMSTLLDLLSGQGEAHG